MDDATKKALLDDLLGKVGPQGIGQFIMEQNNNLYVGQQQPVQMPPYLTHDRAMELYTFLIDGGYIDKATSSEDFLYLMGASATAPLNMKPINWFTTVQQLRTMLTCAFETPLKRGSVKLAEIERRAPYCFLNKGKKMTNLAKPSVEYSTELDNLQDFFRPKSAPI